MLKNYEFKKYMEIREKLSKRIKGQIFVGKNNDDITISIFGCPTCRYRTSLNTIRSNSSQFIFKTNINEIVDAIYEDYKKFINKKFFI